MIITAKNGLKIDLNDFKNAGYGKFTDFVRNHVDENFRREGMPKKYLVKMNAIQSVSVKCELEIMAFSEDEAEKKAYKADKYWEEDFRGDTEIEDEEIQEICLVEEEE